MTRAARSRHARHLKLQLRAAVDSGFGLEFFRIGGAVNARYDARVVHRFAALPVLNGDIQRGALSCKPGFRIDQNECEDFRDGCGVRNACACGRFGFLRQGKMQRSRSKLLDDRAVLLIETLLERLFALRIQREEIEIIVRSPMEHAAMEIDCGVDERVGRAAILVWT